MMGGEQQCAVPQLTAVQKLLKDAHTGGRLICGVWVGTTSSSFDCVIFFLLFFCSLFFVFVCKVSFDVERKPVRSLCLVFGICSVYGIDFTRDKCIIHFDYMVQQTRLGAVNHCD